MAKAAINKVGLDICMSKRYVLPRMTTFTLESLPLPALNTRRSIRGGFERSYSVVCASLCWVS